MRKVSLDLSLDPLMLSQLLTCNKKQLLKGTEIESEVSPPEMCVIYVNNCQDIYPVVVDPARLLPRVERLLTDCSGAAGAAGASGEAGFLGFGAFDAESVFLGDAFDAAFFFFGDAASLCLPAVTAFSRLDLVEGGFCVFPLVGFVGLAGEGEAGVDAFAGCSSSVPSSSSNDGQELSCTVFSDSKRNLFCDFFP